MSRIALLASLLLVPPVAASGAGADLVTLERRVPELMRAGDVPGLSIAVIRDGKLFWSGAFGVADPSTGAAARPDTIFQAASLSKPVFAYAVLRLVDRGALGLDTPLTSYLPYERFADERAQRITARMVLSHTTGLPNWGDDKLKLAFPPGERFSYSGEGFFYLQKVVEKITGVPLAELARREVFAPLGMTRSSYVWPGGSAAAGVDDSGNIQPTDPGQKANAAASLLTTATDYTLFLLAVTTGHGLKPETAALLLTPQVHVPSKLGDPQVPPRDDISWGLGWGLVKTADSDIFWHWGHQDAWRAFTAVRRDGRAGLVFFANSATGLSIARELCALAGLGGLPALDWLGYESFDDPRWTARRELVHVFATAGAEAGLRRLAEMRTATPDVIDTKLTNQVADLLQGRGKTKEAAVLLQQTTEASPSADAYGTLGDAWLAAGDLDRAVQSYQAAAKLNPAAPREAELRWIHEEQEARKTPVQLSEEALRRFVGDYGPRHVRFEGGHLIYRRNGRPASYTLVPANADTFLVEGKSDIRVRFTADSAGRIVKLTVLGATGPQGESPRDP